MAKSKFKRLKIEGDLIMGYEPYFESYVRVASINRKKKEVRPSHGYFHPHHYGKASKSWALRNGYSFIN